MDKPRQSDSFAGQVEGFFMGHQQHIYIYKSLVTTVRPQRFQNLTKNYFLDDIRKLVFSFGDIL